MRRVLHGKSDAGTSAFICVAFVTVQSAVHALPSADASTAAEPPAQ